MEVAVDVAVQGEVRSDGEQQRVAARAEHLQAGNLLQRLHLFDLPGEDEDVAFFEDFVRPYRGDQPSFAFEFQQEQAVEVAQPVLLDAAAGQRRIGGDLRFEKVGLAVFPRGRFVRRQQARAQHHHRNARERERNSDEAELEHLQRRQPCVDHEGIHDEVHRGADQGRDAAQDRCVGKGDQQLGRCHAALLGDHPLQRDDGPQDDVGHHPAQGATPSSKPHAAKWGFSKPGLA